MDCQQALDILDSTFPDSNNQSAPEHSAAATHLQECPQCSARFQNRQELDQVIGRVIQDVPVPVDLKRKILDQLASADSTSATASETTIAATPAFSRRHQLRLLFSVSACVVAGLALWWFSPFGSSSQLTLDELQAELEEMKYDLKTLPDFDGHFKASLPSSRWRRLVGSARGFHQESGGKHLVALHEFRFIGSRGSPVTGILLILKKSLVAEVPPARYFSPSHARYEPVPNMAWNQGELVYVCLIPNGDPQSLDLLRQILQNGLA